jgi:transketolase
MAERGMPKKLARIGLPDTFSHGASKQYLLKEHGMDAMSLVRQVEKMTGRAFGISGDDLAQAHIAAVHSTAKAEAL